ncbi:MAG: formylglycine-generating enzyme family protein [Treponema sp.]
MNKHRIQRAAALFAVTSILSACSRLFVNGGEFSSSAGKTYTADGVDFTMKHIAPVREGRIGGSRRGNESHIVNLNAYWILETEVTQELWQAVMGDEPSFFNDTEENYDPILGDTFDTGISNKESQEKRPVESVNWYECIAFCNELTKKTQKFGAAQCVYYSDSDFDAAYTKADADKGVEPYANWKKKGFRLPLEAEWEWAAQGGKNDKWAGTDRRSKVGAYAWYDKNSGNKTHEVKKKRANGYGLYDMTGNVHEWCWDKSGGTSLDDGDLSDDGGGTGRVLCGGSWYDGEESAALACRGFSGPAFRFIFLGLRVACQ